LIHHSNVMHYSEDASSSSGAGVTSKVGHRVDAATGKKVRYLTRTGKVLQDKAYPSKEERMQAKQTKKKKDDDK